MNTYTYTTDAAPGNEPVQIRGAWAKRVVIYENGQVGTANYTFTANAPGAAAITRPAGAKTELIGPPQGWPQGTVVGYTSAATGSMTMAQEEHEA